jgi:hypothetical protein
VLVGVAGFEPATPSSRTRCATRWVRHCAFGAATFLSLQFNVLCASVGAGHKTSELAEPTQAFVLPIEHLVCSKGISCRKSGWVEAPL